MKWIKALIILSIAANINFVQAKPDASINLDELVFTLSKKNTNENTDKITNNASDNKQKSVSHNENNLLPKKTNLANSAESKSLTEDSPINKNKVSLNTKAARKKHQKLQQEQTQAKSETINNLLFHAMSLLGVAYRFGGTNPATGLDCSGFIQYIFRKSLHINLPRTSAQMAKTGHPVKFDDLTMGDLLFFNTHGHGVSHVGMYIGNGKFIHAPRTGKSIEISKLDTKYWIKHYLGARRISRKASSSSFLNNYNFDSAQKSSNATDNFTPKPSMRNRKITQNEYNKLVEKSLLQGFAVSN